MQISKKYINKLIASEISTISRYYDLFIQLQALQNDTGQIFDAVECSEKIQIPLQKELPDLTQQREKRSIIFFNGNFNHNLDIQGLLMGLKQKLSRRERARCSVLLNNENIIWVVGHRIDESVKVTEATRNILKAELFLA